MGEGPNAFSYDVNKVKRNFVQEALAGFKWELFSLLNSTSHESIDERVQNLVEINPVSTTTDSNLLDGRWHLAYSSVPVKHTSMVVSLENLPDLEQPHVVEEGRRRKKFYSVEALTRTTLVLELRQVRWKMGFLKLRKNARRREVREIRVEYLDGDLCICTEKEGYWVYTKSDFRGAFNGHLEEVRPSEKTNVSRAEVLPPVTTEPVDTLPAPELRISLQDENSLSWESSDDPFGHLSYEEKLGEIKKLSLEELEILRLEEREKRRSEYESKKSFKGIDGKGVDL